MEMADLSMKSPSSHLSKGRKPKNLEMGVCKTCSENCNGGNAVR